MDWLVVYLLCFTIGAWGSLPGGYLYDSFGSAARGIVLLSSFMRLNALASNRRAIRGDLRLTPNVEGYGKGSLLAVFHHHHHQEYQDCLCREHSQGTHPSTKLPIHSYLLPRVRHFVEETRPRVDFLLRQRHDVRRVRNRTVLAEKRKKQARKTMVTSRVNM